MKMLLQHTKYHGEYNEHQGDGTCRTVGLCRRGKGGYAIRYGVSIKGTCNHIGKCCDNDQGK